MLEEPERTGSIKLLTENCDHDFDEAVVKVIEEAHGTTGKVVGKHKFTCPVCKTVHQVEIKEFVN